MKTYSKRNKGSLKNSNQDAVFSAVCKHSMVSDSSPANTTGNSDENKLDAMKRKNVKSKQRELKKLPTKSKQVAKKNKLGKSDQAAIESNVVALSHTNDDPLFGDGPILLQETKKPPSRRKKNANNAVKVTQEKLVEVNGARSSLHNKIPPNEQVGSEDKVSQWLAGSRDADPVPHHLPETETSIEIFREVRETADDRRHHIFLDHDILGNLHMAPNSLDIESTVTSDKKSKAKRDNFLAKFEDVQKKSFEPTLQQQHTMQESRSTKTPGSSRKSGSKRSSWSQEESTELGTTYTAETEMSTPITGLISTRTHTSDSGRDLQSTFTNTQTTMAGSSWKKRTPASKKKYMSSTMRRSSSTTSMDAFPSELSTVTESVLTKNEKQKQDEKTPQRYTNDFKVPGSPTKSGSNKTQKKGSLQPRNSTQLFTSGFVEIVNVIPQMSTIMMDQDSRNTTVAQKTVCSNVEDEADIVMKKGTTKTSMKTSTPNKANLPDTQFQFDTDISSVTMDSGEDDELVFNQSSREVCSAEILHLSTTRIEEIAKDDDTIQVPVTKQDDKESHSKSRKHGTPQSANQGPVISDKTVTKRRKSSTNKPGVSIVEPSIEQNNNAPSKFKRRRHSAKNPNIYTVEQSAVNARHPMSLKVAREKNMKFLKGKHTGTDTMHNRFDDMFGNPKRTLRFSSMSSTPRSRAGQLRFSSEKGCSPGNTENGPDQETGDNSVFESEPCGEDKKRNVPVCPLMNDFICPKKNVSMLVYTTNDTRSFDEIRQTVPVDDIR